MTPDLRASLPDVPDEQAIAVLALVLDARSGCPMPPQLDRPANGSPRPPPTPLLPEPLP